MTPPAHVRCASGDGAATRAEGFTRGGWMADSKTAMPQSAFHGVCALVCSESKTKHRSETRGESKPNHCEARRVARRSVETRIRIHCAYHVANVTSHECRFEFLEASSRSAPLDRSAANCLSFLPSDLNGCHGREWGEPRGCQPEQAVGRGSRSDGQADFLGRSRNLLGYQLAQRGMGPC